MSISEKIVEARDKEWTGIVHLRLKCIFRQAVNGMVEVSKTEVSAWTRRVYNLQLQSCYIQSRTLRDHKTNRFCALRIRIPDRKR